MFGTLRKCLVGAVFLLCFAHIANAASIDVYVSNINGSRVNSGRIAFHSYTEYDDDDPPDGTYSLDGVIHIWDLDSDTPYTLGQDTIRSGVDHAMNPTFSSDGSQLVFMGLRKNSHPTDATWAEALDIFMYDFRTNQLTNLSQLATLGSSIDEDPAFSPDGSKVVFKRSRSDLWELSVADYSLKNLTNSASVEESGPRYSPDGNWILFWVGDGAGSYIGKIPSSGGAIQMVVDNYPWDSPGIQDYFPSYWGDDKIIYTSWDTPQYYPAKDDDDIKVYSLSNSSDVFAAFNTSSDDSDSFPLTDSVIGFSTKYDDSLGKWDLWYGNPFTGTAQRFDFSHAETHDLGGEYTHYVVNFEGVPEINVLGNGHSIGDGDRTPSTSDGTDLELVAHPNHLIKEQVLYPYLTP